MELLGLHIFEKERGMTVKQRNAFPQLTAIKTQVEIYILVDKPFYLVAATYTYKHQLMEKETIPHWYWSFPLWW